MLFAEKSQLAGILSNTPFIMGILVTIVVAFLIYIVIKFLFPYIKKIGPVEFKDKDPAAKTVKAVKAKGLKVLHGDSSQSCIDKATVKKNIYQVSQEAEKCVENIDSLKERSRSVQLEKVNRYLEEITSDLTANYVRADIASKDQVEDFADVLQLFLQRDLNQFIYSEVKLLIKDGIGQRNDNDLSTDAERIAKSCLIRIRSKFIHYPGFLGTDAIEKIFINYEPQLLTALISCLSECKKEDDKSLKEILEVRAKYQEQLNNIINTLFQFDTTSSTEK